LFWPADFACRRLGEVLSLPDVVKLSRRDPGVHLYYKHYDNIYGGKYLLAVVNSRRKSIATIFVTDKIKAGETLWAKK